MVTELEDAVKCMKMIESISKKHEEICEKQYNSMKGYILFLTFLLVFTWITLWLVLITGV